MRLSWVLAAAAASAGCTAVAPATDPAARVAVGGPSQLAPIFTQVAAETGVPAEVLAAVSFVRTRFALVEVVDRDHGGESLGIFGLPRAELVRGAALAGVTDDAAIHDALASVRAGAALWRDAAGGARDLDMYLAMFGGGEITAVLRRGISWRGVVVGAQPALAAVRDATARTDGDHPGTPYDPASSSNYQVASRAVGDIDHVVIHDTEGSFAGSVSWFKDPSAQVSAHYITRSSDGYIEQMVREQNIAWHDKCFNTTTVGIEHEGYQAHPTDWYTETMYVESAKLTAYLCDKYGIAKERGPIVGHGDAPDCSDHTDPGPGWNWDHYIDLVKTGGAPTFAADGVEVDAPATMTSGDIATVTVRLSNTGNTTWDLDATRLGTAEPQDRASQLFVDGSWIAPNRAAAVDATVAPGGVGTFAFQIVAPDVKTDTTFDEVFQPVQEGVTWFGPEVHVTIDVAPKPDSSGGCAAGGSGAGGLVGLGGLAGLALLRRRRR